MNATADRLLRVLTLLQSGRAWSGAALSERLEVDRRTVRRDIDRLRGLGYTVQASSGPGGGYRFTPGARLPPLVLDDDEAATIMVALQTAAGSLARMEETAAAVRLKLGQLLPARVQARLDALQAMVVPLGESSQAVDPIWLTALATACRESRRVGFDYRDGQGRESTRRLEPARLVHTWSRWYLVAWDLDRDDWRTFRVDRIACEPTLGSAVEPRPFPSDVAEYVQRGISARTQAFTARVELPGSATANAERVPDWLGVLEAVDDHRCTLTVGAPHQAALVGLLAGLGLPFRLLDPPELGEALATAAERLKAAAAPPERATVEARAR